MIYKNPEHSHFLTYFILAGFCILLLFSQCNSPGGFTVDEPVALGNFLPDKNEKAIMLDYISAIDSGFIIPSVTQTPSGYFHFSFKLKNNEKQSSGYFYKIFYQNESYMFKEMTDSGYNRFASENFYGSWENPDDSIRIVTVAGGEQALVTDSFRITGNPLNDTMYYGPSRKKLSESEVQTMMNYIKTDKIWFGDIQKKAANEKRTVDEQLRLDAAYMLNEQRKEQKVNYRSRRNPRVGTYKFYLLIAKESDLPKIPKQLKKINEPVNGTYVNPVYHLKTKKDLPEDVLVIHFDQTLHVKAIPDLGAGIYADKTQFRNKDHITEQYYNNTCNDDSALYWKAPFKQFVHQLPENFNFPNIPVVADLDNITPEDYNKYLEQFSAKDMLPYANVPTPSLCETVTSDPVEGKIIIKNPGVRENRKVKENVGVISRHGLTYGTYTFKVKMPGLLNKHNVWNGLTNALWMINESNEEWNRRRSCETGYIPKEISASEKAERKKSIQYSEIDFEISKAHPYWPLTSYSKEHPRPVYKGNDEDQIIVACTNWDLACSEPPLFDVGVRPLKHNENVHANHRWNHWYQALTSKYPAPDDELFDRPYYFQIEWKPESITWRIGPEKNNLREVGYMNTDVTSIPNNQMLIVFTQEYHISAWWPESRFLQEYIPLSAKDIVGEILSVEIE